MFVLILKILWLILIHCLSDIYKLGIIYALIIPGKKAREKTNLEHSFFVLYIEEVDMTLNERITAVHVMQRFVRMSRTLLPIYSELLHKKNLSRVDKANIQSIRRVYDNFHADPKASNILINSNILGMIQRVYGWLRKSQGVASPESLYDYEMFLQESDRLIHTWDKQLMN